MGRCAALVAVAAALGMGGEAARASLPGRIDVRAHSVRLYPGAPALLEADGAAFVRVGSRVVRADSVRYDLGKNKLVASGHVDATTPQGELHAAAYALDVASGDATALLLDGALPQTVVFRSDQGAGTVAPAAAEVFEVTDLSNQKPFLRGPHAVIVPNATVRIAPARVLTDVGTSVPSPSFLYTFSTNPSFSQQSLPGATFDQPYGLFGTPSSLLAVHFRYDPTAGAGVGLEEHLVDRSKSYVVASALGTLGGARFDLFGFQQITPVLSHQIISSHIAGYNSVQYQLLHNESASVTSLTLNQLAGLQTADLRISSLSHLIPRLFSYKFSAGVGYDHQNGMLPFSSDSRATLEGLFTTPSIRAPFGSTLTSSLDVTSTLYDFPRETGSSNFGSFLSKPVSRTVRLIGQVQFLQVFDRYRTNQRSFYPAQTVVLPDGSIYYGFAAYNGASTSRLYALSGTYSPNANFNLQLSLTHHRDFPQFDGYGNPPYSLGFDVRVRPKGGPSIEVGRAYIFNWGNQRFAPTYTLSIAP